MRPKTRILIVDDHADIRTAIATYLTREGFNVGTAANGADMDTYLADHTIDLLILDVMMPGEDGRSICARLHRESDMPILMVSALDADDDKIAGLNLGADDYLAKPFNPKELLARINALLRRRPPSRSTQQCFDGQTVIFGGLSLDVDARRLRKPNSASELLTSAELKLLLIFLERPRSVISRDDLLKLATGRQAGPLDRTIDNQVSRLRKKVEPDVLRPRIISTIRNGGYSLTCDVEIMQ